jgi:hypothetical protein
LLPLALYAETHFRFFRGMPSALFRREPEAVFDLPRRFRVGRGGLPVVLLVNDVHRFPIRIESIQVTVSRAGVKPVLFDFDPPAVEAVRVDHPLGAQLDAYLFTLPGERLGGAGEIFVNACLRYRRVRNGRVSWRTRAVLNDNLATSSKLPFRCVIADGDYPGGGLCDYGDLHCHTMFSRSHVEFGPPVEIIDKVAAAGGLRFIAATDHSYDLACDPDNYLRQDRNLRLWEMYMGSVVNNYRGETLMIPSEEVSVLNSKNRVVHLCGLGISEYIPGTLDGARKSIYTDRQLTIEEAISDIERQGGVSFAAHAGSRAGTFQKIFLRRGEWGESDLCGKLGGVQAVNGNFGGSWIRGKQLWVSMLLKGQKIPVLAGSDAHGDFNRYRAIAVPFLRLYENRDRYMGFVRTGVYGKRIDAKGIVDGIRDGETFITNGPYAAICDIRRPDIPLVGSKKSVLGMDNDTANHLCVRAVSTEEFGLIRVITVIMGIVGKTEENIIMRQSLPDDTYDATIPIVDTIPHPSEQKYYLRTEVYGETGRGGAAVAATSACFVGY